MTSPRELLRRAAANRREGAPRTERAESAAPRRTAVQSHHATYTALIHSHDRMRTRHLPERAGKG